MWIKLLPPAPKVLLLTPREGWHRASAGKLKVGDCLRPAVRAVKQFAAEEGATAYGAREGGETPPLP